MDRMKRLGELLPEIKLLQHADMPVTGMTLDSRGVKPGHMFVAIRGNAADGRRFVPEAIQAGAIVICQEAEKADQHGKVEQVESGALVVLYFGLRERVGEIAARFYDFPSRKLQVIGITGTNGKTSCAYLGAQALEKCGINSALIGTIGAGVVGQLEDIGNTTPDAVTTQRLLNEFVDKEVDVVLMEVSSHAIAQHRIDGVDFALAVFTNLTHDHLDYHHSFEEYARVKKSFFLKDNIQEALINIDDSIGKSLYQEVCEQTNLGCQSYGCENDQADLYADAVSIDGNGIQFDLCFQGGKKRIVSSLAGEFNLYNLLVVWRVLKLLMIDDEEAARAIAGLESVPGRLELLSSQRGSVAGPKIYLDYAHTPDALRKSIMAVRQNCRGKLWVVFGCGGNRDKAKRPAMGRIASENSDVVIVTSDNPRNESGESIAAEIVSGMKQAENWRIVLDRSEAIGLAIDEADMDDAVLIAGKGHEEWQCIGTEKIPFSDKTEALRALKQKVGECYDA